MAEVHIVDIDGEQWNIKDSPLTTRVALLEQLLTTETKETETIELSTGVTARLSRIENIVQFGKILQCNFVITNIAATGIGTTTGTKIGNCSIKPVDLHTCILRDYISGNTIRLTITKNGDIYFSESNGINSGSNAIRGSATIIIQ